MTITARISTVFVAFLAATSLSATTLASTAEARPKTPKPAQLSQGQCDTLKMLSNDMSKGAEEAYAAGDKARGDQLSKAADDLWAEAARGGCRWATWRTKPSNQIRQADAHSAIS